MIVVRLLGGLGNQMFQYALGRALALKNHDCLKLDLERYTQLARKAGARQFALSHFNIQAEIATPAEIYRAKYPLGALSEFVLKLRKQPKDLKVGFDPAVLRRKGNLYLEGFWQSEDYFKQYSDAIRKDFTPKESLGLAAQTILDEINNADAAGRVPVSVHVRRGDYVHHPQIAQTLGTLADQYYLQAAELLTEKIQSARIQLFISSDDIPWVQSHLHLKFAATYVSRPGIQDWEEMLLMAACRHHIIANSSFSWWGAWLNVDPTKIVIGPARWALKNPARYTDILPPAWLRV